MTYWPICLLACWPIGLLLSWSTGLLCTGHSFLWTEIGPRVLGNRIRSMLHQPTVPTPWAMERAQRKPDTVQRRACLKGSMHSMLKPSLGEDCKKRDYRLSKSRAAPPPEGNPWNLKQSHGVHGTTKILDITLLIIFELM